MSEEIVKWGDDAQYLSAPIKRSESGKIVPVARLSVGDAGSARRNRSGGQDV